MDRSFNIKPLACSNIIALDHDPQLTNREAHLVTVACFREPLCIPIWIAGGGVQHQDLSHPKVRRQWPQHCISIHSTLSLITRSGMLGTCHYFIEYPLGHVFEVGVCGYNWQSEQANIRVAHR